MRLSFLFLIMLAGTFCLQAQENKDFRAIRSAMAAQVEAWNQGDIEKFMAYYWQSESLQFIGGNGPTYGWQSTIERYKKAYPDKAAMGKLRFDIFDINRRSKKVITLLGKYTLEREKDAPSGYFLLVWQKIKGKWLIVADHTN